MAADKERARIIAALRKLWMMCATRNDALKRDNRTCQVCLKKLSASEKKLTEEPDKYCKSLNVHHTRKGGVDWDKIVTVIRQELLCDPKYLICLCKECHNKEHRKEKK